MVLGQLAGQLCVRSQERLVARLWRMAEQFGLAPGVRLEDVAQGFLQRGAMYGKAPIQSCKVE